MIHNFGDHRLRTNGDRRFIVRRSPTTYERRSPLHRSAITDYVRTEIATSSFGDNRLHTHGDRRFIDWRLYWPSACPHPHRPSLPMTFCSSRMAMMHNFGDHRLRTNGDRRFIRRQPTTYTRRSPLYRLAIILAFRVSSSTSPLSSNDLLFIKDGDGVYSMYKYRILK